ncbi:MAG: hypothetical protein MK066_05045 [Crocinitomicaceae bacterium]|nr:hypothetical protein [Crocinitomicaceae bacterium]
MNIRNWSKGHTFGLILGILVPLLVVPLVLLIQSFAQNYTFERLWRQFEVIRPFQIKMLTISLIANLVTFYIFLNKERYKLAMGIILGTIAYAPYIIYIKFF